MRTTLMTFTAIVALVACSAPPQETVSVDPALLHAALTSWQEASGICLDPIVLELRTVERTSPRKWADSVLIALASDPRVSVDSTQRQDVAGIVRRTCTATRLHPRVSLGVPRIRGDTAIVESSAFAPASGTDSAFTLRSTALLVRRDHRWRIVDYPDRQYKLLPSNDRKTQ